MTTLYTILLCASAYDTGTPTLRDIVDAHSRKNEYGYPVDIRWQDLLDDLFRRGRLRKPAKNNTCLPLESFESYGEVLLCDGTPAGLFLVWDGDTLAEADIFAIPEHLYRDDLEERLPLGTLILPEGTTVRMRNADGKTTPVELLSLRRDPDSRLLTVKTRWAYKNIIEEFARDLHVADIYQILQTINPATR